MVEDQHGKNIASTILKNQCQIWGKLDQYCFSKYIYVGIGIAAFCEVCFFKVLYKFLCTGKESMVLSLTKRFFPN